MAGAVKVIVENLVFLRRYTSRSTSQHLVRLGAKLTLRTLQLYCLGWLKCICGRVWPVTTTPHRRGIRLHHDDDCAMSMISVAVYECN